MEAVANHSPLCSYHSDSDRVSLFDRSSRISIPDHDKALRHRAVLAGQILAYGLAIMPAGSNQKRITMDCDRSQRLAPVMTATNNSMGIRRQPLMLSWRRITRAALWRRI